MYEQIMHSIWLVGGILTGTYIFIQLLYSCYRWLNDKPYKTIYATSKMRESNDEWEITVMAIVLPLLITFVSGLLWPVAMVVIPFLGIMYGLRKAIRFKKKVNEVLDTKSDIGHGHE